MPGAGRFMSPLSLLVLALLAVNVLSAGCGDGEVTPPPDGLPTLRVARTAAELDTAFRTVTAGDTIEIDGGFSGSQFVMTQGYVFDSGVSPLVIRSTNRTLEAEIVFPPTVDGLTFRGHDGTRLNRLSIRGTRTAIVLDDSRVLLDTLEIHNPARDGIEAMGNDSSGRVRGCFIEFIPIAGGGNGGRFGIVTGDNSRLTIDKNTIVDAGDCGMHIGSNDIVRNNNIVRSRLHGIYFDDNSTAPMVSCNNAFMSGTANYGAVNDIGVPGDNNFGVNPRFCPGSYRLSVNSPLTAANAGACGLIGATAVEEGCVPN